MMRNRPFRSTLLLAMAVLSPGLASGQKLDKDDKKFLDDVRPLLLQDEEKTYKGLKEKGDRLEFQKIFWARRDPDLATPENEYQAAYLAARATADQTYRVPAQAGSTTDCGRTFILLGKPDEVRQESTESPGLRAPETWTYRDRPGQTFAGGKAEISFDPECRAPAGFASQLERVAAARVLQPNIDYRMGKDGRLTKLVDLLPKDTAARALMKQPRQEFPLAAQASFLKVADGGTAILGLVRGDAASLATADSGGVKTVNVSVAASAVGEDGKEAGWTEQSMKVPVGADGAWVASFKLGVKAGKYTLKAGAVDLKGGKASLAALPVDVPDLNRVETAADGTTTKVPTAGSVFVVTGMEDLAGGSNPEHPFSAYELGRVRLVPAFGGVVRKATDQVEIFYQVYDLKLDPATGKADAVALVSILKDGKTPVAKAPPNLIETEFAGSSVGPIPLANYEPGKYTVQLKVTDKLGKKEIVQEAPLEIVP
jgi:GWxTD domain-containing protein